MSVPIDIPRTRSEPNHLGSVSSLGAEEMARTGTESSSEDAHPAEPVTPLATPGSPGFYPGSLGTTPGLLSRNSSFIGAPGGGSYMNDWETFHPEKLSVGTPADTPGSADHKLKFFELFDSLSLPSQLEKWQAGLNAQAEKIRRQQERLRSTGTIAKNRAIKVWRKRIPTAEEQLDKYRKRMSHSVDHLSKRWRDTATIGVREKVSFVSAVINVFISGYLIGACPQYFYYWFTLQLAYFMPIRFITYYNKGYHYFLADLCYFVNFLTLCTIWAFPRSKRLFISTYCLAYGNNAVAIAFWRNSLVFHSLDKVTSLFIHLMPPVTLHCLVHLTPSHILHDRFPAIFNIKYSPLDAPEHYSLYDMLIWATLPYAIWQLSYYFFITVRKAEKIAEGRPTSFVWLRRSYAKTWIGKFVNNLPDRFQEPAFMMIQYTYALLTIMPCPLWFWKRWASAGFLLTVFGWSVWNGANYYMDIFGKRFQRELEAMKRDVAKWQSTPDAGMMISPDIGAESKGHNHNKSVDSIPPLDDKLPDPMEDDGTTTAVDLATNGAVVERKTESSEKSPKIGTGLLGETTPKIGSNSMGSR